MADSTENGGFYNLHDMSQGIPRKLAEGIATRIFPGDRAMLSVVRLEPNSQGVVHSHPQEQWGVMLEGSVVRVQGDAEIEAKAGDFWRTPGGVPHTVRAGPQGAVILDIFAPPRDEYRKAGKGFGGG